MNWKQPSRYGIVLLLGLTLGLLWAYQVSPKSTAQAPALALSAHIERGADATHWLLRIMGEAQQGGKPLAEGQAKVTVERLKDNSSTSALLEVRQGKFEGAFGDALQSAVAGVPVTSMPSLQANEPLKITGEVWSPQLGNATAKEAMYLNSTVIVRRRVTIYLLAALLGLAPVVVFLWAFTGSRSLLKNRVAIGFSYLVILLCLGVPFLAANLVLSSPFLRGYMKDAPVGLLISKVNDEPQWVLNIGGYVEKKQLEAKPEASDFEVLNLEHGLIVPIYVIILAMVGSAINMTKQVPRYQPESERIGGLSLITAPGEPIERRKNQYRERRRRDWRTGLISHYMYLVSSPFVAIAAYYLLVSLGINNRVPIVVLVSFSVGLISDPILRKITDTGYSFLRHTDGKEKGSQAPPASGQGSGGERKPVTSVTA
jgi:hypothetical protein